MQHLSKFSTREYKLVKFMPNNKGPSFADVASFDKRIVRIGSAFFTGLCPENYVLKKGKSLCYAFNLLAELVLLI